MSYMSELHLNLGDRAHQAMIECYDEGNPALAWHARDRMYHAVEQELLAAHVCAPSQAHDIAVQFVDDELEYIIL